MGRLKRHSIAVLLVLSACGAEAVPLGSTTTVLEPVSSTVTQISEVTTTLAPATTATGATSPPTSDLMVRQILLRYDGRRVQGTIEVTVCNTGDSAGLALGVDLATAGSVVRLPLTGPIDPGDCRETFDPSSSFATFGIDKPGAYDITATVLTTAPDPAGNDARTETVIVGRLETRTPGHDAYDQCRSAGSHSECWYLIASAPAADPPEVAKIHGSSTAVVPAEYTALASWVVADNEQCAQRIASYLDVPQVGPYSERVLVGDSWRPPRAGRLHMAITFEITREDAEAEILALPGPWGSLASGRCWNTHEFTHLYLGFTGLPTWLDEGLATYLDHPARIDGYGTFKTQNYGPVPLEPDAPGDGLVVCRPDGIEYDYVAANNHFFHRYEDLDDLDGPPIPGESGRFYATASCFWDYLETTFGHRALQGVVGALIAERDATTSVCTAARTEYSFLDDYVTPVIGEDISEFTERRFGFGTSWNGCTT